METYTAINILNNEEDPSSLKCEDFYIYIFIVNLKSICSVHRKKTEEYILEIPK